MTTTYKVNGTFGKATPFAYIMDEEALATLRSDRLYTIASVEPYTTHINYRTAEGCERCTTDEYVPHYNCLYGGKAVGHSASHCTANGCY